MKPLGKKSITLRLTLLFTVVSALVLTTLGLAVGALVERHFEEMDTELLVGKFELVGHALWEHSQSALSDRLDAALVGHHGLAVAIWDASGKPIYSHGSVDFPSIMKVPGTDLRTHPKLWRNEDGQLFRGISGTVTGGAIVAVSTELQVHEHFMHSFNKTFWGLVALAAIASGLFGWLAARGGFPLTGNMPRYCGDYGRPLRPPADCRRLPHRTCGSS